MAKNKKTEEVDISKSEVIETEKMEAATVVDVVEKSSDSVLDLSTETIGEQPVILDEDPVVSETKEDAISSNDNEVVSLIKKVAYQQHFGGWGTHLNQLLTDELRKNEGYQNAVISNGHIVK